MRYISLSLPFLAGCFGVYAEIAATTLPSAAIETTTNTGATSIGFNIGAEFSSTRMRFAVGYASDTTTFEGGSGSLGTSSSRFDFNVFSLSDRARVRLGLGFARGTGSSELNGMSQSNSDGGSAFAGLDVSYFLTWKIGLHAFAGPTYFSQSIPGGTVNGSGATFRLAVSYTFGDVRPDTTYYIPLEGNRDITGLLESGAAAMGCTTRRNSSSQYAFLYVTCGGDTVMYLQTAEGMGVHCDDMFKHQCHAFTLRLTTATKAVISAPESPPAAPPVTPAVAPAPPPQPAAPEAAPDAAPAPDAVPTPQP